MCIYLSFARYYSNVCCIHIGSAQNLKSSWAPLSTKLSYMQPNKLTTHFFSVTGFIYQEPVVHFDYIESTHLKTVQYLPKKNFKQTNCIHGMLKLPYRGDNVKIDVQLSDCFTDTSPIFFFKELLYFSVYFVIVSSYSINGYFLNKNHLLVICICNY